MHAFVALIVSAIALLTSPSPASPPSASPQASATAAASKGAFILNTGSTNSPGYTAMVYPDGSVDLTVFGKTSHPSVPAPSANALFAALEAAGPLDRLVVFQCMKSVSFGFTIRLTWNGKRSPDITCGGDYKVQSLQIAVHRIEADLQPEIHALVRPATAQSPSPKAS